MSSFFNLVKHHRLGLYRSSRSSTYAIYIILSVFSENVFSYFPFQHQPIAPHQMEGAKNSRQTFQLRRSLMHNSVHSNSIVCSLNQSTPHDLSDPGACLPIRSRDAPPYFFSHIPAQRTRPVRPSVVMVFQLPADPRNHLLPRDGSRTSSPSHHPLPNPLLGSSPDFRRTFSYS